MGDFQALLFHLPVRPEVKLSFIKASRCIFMFCIVWVKKLMVLINCSFNASQFAADSPQTKLCYRLKYQFSCWHCQTGLCKKTYQNCKQPHIYSSVSYKYPTAASSFSDINATKAESSSNVESLDSKCV